MKNIRKKITWNRFIKTWLLLTYSYISSQYFICICIDKHIKTDRWIDKIYYGLYNVLILFHTIHLFY